MDALFGDYEVIRKSGLFDPEFYLAAYPDVAERNVDPLVHYLEEGAGEGRDPSGDFDAGFYREQCEARGERPGNPLLHYIRIGAARGFKTRRDEAGDGPPAGGRPAGAETAPKQPILVAVEVLGVLGDEDGGSRLYVGGWALAAAPISEIAVALGGETLGTAYYGLARPDVARLYPGRAGASECGFMLTCHLPPLKSGPMEPLLTVRTEDGELGHRPLRVEIPPQRVETIVIDPLDRNATREMADRPAVEICIEEAVVLAGGILHVQGWAVARTQIECIEAFIGDGRIGEAAFGRVREDIESERPDYPNARFSGFLLAAPLDPGIAGEQTLAIAVRARGGVSERATAPLSLPARRARAPSVPDPGFRWHCDELVVTTAGRVTIRGWAVCAAPVASVVVTIDGEEIGRAAAGLDRPDVGNLFPAVAHARQAGFALDERTGKFIPGECVVGLRVCCTDGAIHEAAMPVKPREASYLAAASTAGNQDRVLHLDSPELFGGDAELPVRGNLEINGFALARETVATIEVALDGTPIVIADYGFRRLDVQSAFPDWPDAPTSGYRAVLPQRILPKGSHSVSITLRDNAGETTTIDFRIAVEEMAGAPGPWSLRRKVSPAELDLNRRLLDACNYHPLFVAILPVAGDDASLSRARATIASLQAQAYPNWRLIVTGAAEADRKGLVTDTEFLGERIAFRREVAPDAVSVAHADDSWFTVLMPGDELGIDAFLEIAVAAAQHREADFLYSDERRPDPATGVVSAFFKPQWSPDLLLSTNYIGRLWCARAGLAGALADTKAQLLCGGEYDLVLRLTELARNIRHVPAVLCERGGDPLESPQHAKKALEAALLRRGIAGEVVPGRALGAWQISRALDKKPGRVSIVVPTCAARGLIKTCIESLRRLTAYPDYEIVCVENIPAGDRKWRGWLRRNADRVVSVKGPFNWARFNNIAAAEASGEYLLFLNDDIEVTDPDWLTVLVEQAQRPDIGVVGPQLLYPDGRVQHAGMFLAAMGQARHAFRYLAGDAPGYFGLALTQRNVIAVTGACLLTRRETFAALGGFDESHAIVNNDLDYCLKAWRSGLLNVYAPQARLIHHEAVSRAALEDEYDVATFDETWRELFLAGDPFYSPHLSKNHDDFAIEDEPTEFLVTGRPSLAREEIRKILVLKLDHIGDCVTAFPAVRRLKRYFPEATVSVLTSRASRPVWSLEPSVAETIEFDFFHARSGDGELKLTEENWAALRERLAPERFDLAIDLRKHTETRPVLQYSGARYLAGFDFRNQFPWLDIALEWSGDQIYARKHQHVTDDLVNLVDAVGAACERDRNVITVTPAPAAATVLAPIRAKAGSRPLVCVHPTVGNDARQWPIEHFVAVIDRLAEEDEAHVVLIGGPGDEKVAAEILRRVRRPQAVTSAIGKLPLADLPALLSQAALFLGNNSGPKHIAAGLGVPTVGIHSGTEDVREWGPVGPTAVALARDMICAPCYLSYAKDCHRGLACLRGLEPARVYDACKRLLLASARAPAEQPPLPAARARPRAAAPAPVAASRP